MFYAIIQRPETDTSPITEISKKYDPYFGLTGPHVTLVFPFKADKVDQDDLIKHAEGVARQTKPYSTRFNELQLAWDQWLFLTPTEGRQAITDLHDRLYSRPLARFLRGDIEFVPHISLGLFAKKDTKYDLRNPTAVPLDEPKYETARAEIESRSLDVKYTATKFEIISVNDEFTQTRTIKVIPFGENDL